MLGRENAAACLRLPPDVVTTGSGLIEVAVGLRSSGRDPLAPARTRDS